MLNNNQVEERSLGWLGELSGFLLTLRGFSIVSILGGLLLVAVLIYSLFHDKRIPVIETKSINIEDHSSMSGVKVRPGLEIPLDRNGRIKIVDGVVTEYTSTN